MTRGHVYRLCRHLREIPAGLYTPVDVGHMITLCRLWANEDGFLSPTTRLFKLRSDEAEEFEITQKRVNLYHADRSREQGE